MGCPPSAALFASPFLSRTAIKNAVAAAAATATLSHTEAQRERAARQPKLTWLTAGGLIFPAKKKKTTDWSS